MNIQDLLDECENEYWNDDYGALIGLCDEILKKDPENPIAMGYKSISCRFLKRYDEALELLDEAIGLHPDNYYFRNNLALVYYDLGDYEKSLECCNEGLEISDFDWLCVNKFKNLIKLERFDEAIEFERVFRHKFNRNSVFMDDDMAEHKEDYCRRLEEDTNEMPSSPSHDKSGSDEIDGEKQEESKFILDESKYPMSYKEYERRVVELFLEYYSGESLEIMKERVNEELSNSPNCIEGYYGQDCFTYDHPEIYGETCKRTFEDNFLKQRPVSELRMLIA